MSSIAEECNDLKKAYDDCFNAWFSERFLKGDRNLTRCDALLNAYTGCVKVCMYTLKQIGFHIIHNLMQA